jgi:hypothetical protein
LPKGVKPIAGRSEPVPEEQKTRCPFILVNMKIYRFLNI